MADDVGMKKRPPQAVFEPGTLDNTRKNIGVLDAEEAAKTTANANNDFFINIIPKIYICLYL